MSHPALRMAIAVAALHCSAPEPARPGTARAGLSFTLSTQAEFSAGASAGVDVASVPGAVLVAPRPDWWDARWQYRLPIEVDAGTFDRVDYPLELPIDGPGLLAFADAGFDATSVRLAEKVDGGPLEVPSAFDVGADAGSGLLMFALAGPTAQGQVRPYDVYLDTAARGPKGPPAYLLSAPDASVDNGVIAFPLMGEGVSGDAEPMSFAALETHAPALDFVWVRHNRISYPGTDCASVTAEEMQPLAANAYQEVDPPRLLLTTPALQVHRMVAQAGALRLSQYTMLGSGAAARLLMVVENTSASEVDGGQYFEGVDIDIGPSAADDFLTWEASDGILHGSDGTPADIGIRADADPAHHAAVIGAVWISLSSEQLNDAPGAGPGDVEGALQYPLPPLAPGQRWFLHESWGVSTSGYPAARDAVLNLSELPELRAFAIEGIFPQTASWTSAPIDSGDPAAQWGAISWTASLPAGAQLRFQTRSGQVPVPDGTWSAWSAPDDTSGAAIPSPPGRYLQLLATFALQPTVEVAPRLDDVTVTASQGSLEVLAPSDPVPSWRDVSFEVVARAPDGGADPGYAGEVAFTSTDSSATLPPPFAFGAADLGRHTFAAIFRTHGAQTITVQEAARPGVAASWTFEVVDQASHLDVGCGCGTSPGSAALWPLAIAALWRYRLRRGRRRRRSPPRPCSSPAPPRPCSSRPPRGHPSGRR